MASACAWYFNGALKNKVSYQRILLYSTIFSFAASNVGLTELIRISIPFLTAIYPVVIVLVVLSLFSSLWKNHPGVYRWSLSFTFAFSIFDGLNAANLQVDAINTLFGQYIPFYAVHLGWLVPAILGAVLGFFLSVRKTSAACAKKEIME